MPQRTNAEKRLDRIRRLVEELDSLILVNVPESRHRGSRIAVELIDLFKAEDEWHTEVSHTVQRAHVSLETAKRITADAQKMSEQCGSTRRLTSFTRSHRNEAKEMA